MNGLMTEREWRKAAQRPKEPRPNWWGAQCVLPEKRRQTLKEDRAFHVFMLLVASVAAILLPYAVRPSQTSPYPQVAYAATQPAHNVRSVKGITYTLPQGLAYRSQTYTREQLLRGKLLLIDSAHPLPKDVPAPNTMSIAAYGKGMVPVNALTLQSGRETIGALSLLFGDLRARGVSGLSVCGGTVGKQQQRALRNSRMYAYAAHMPIDEAAKRVRAQLQAPEACERLQEYTVEIRNDASPNALPQSTDEGRALLQAAWRRGFICSFDENGGVFSLRYVGTAHATAMTFLDLNLQAYLSWLHRQGVLAIQTDGKLRYLILCKPASGTHVEFLLPENARIEVSLDNTGYAVAACTFTD